MEPMDKIKIIDLEVFCNHGVYPEETALGQKFFISATLYTDTHPAGMSDDLTQSIHYGEISHQIYNFMRENTYKLIETAAEQLALHLLCNTRGLQKIKLEVKKPWAPIGLPIQYVSVEICRSWHSAYLSLGSNLGDREAYLQQAISALHSHKYSRVQKVSAWKETEPYGKTDQGKFLNACLELHTLLNPQELLTLLQQIEKDAGRVRIEHWGPRTLDLDILLYDALQLDSETLTIPHPDMQNRAFVLSPLCEIAPDIRHPVLQRTIRQLWADLSGSSSLIPQNSFNKACVK